MGIFLPHYCNTKKTLTDFSPQQIQRYIGISISRLHQGYLAERDDSMADLENMLSGTGKNLRGVSANTQVSDLRSLPNRHFCAFVVAKALTKGKLFPVPDLHSSSSPGEFFQFSQRIPPLQPPPKQL